MERIKSVDATIQSIYSKISRPFRTAFMAAVIFAIIAHLYMFMNKLPNYDDMGLNGFGATFRLGRWFLWVLGATAYHLDFVYSLPWVNGLCTLFFIALSAGLVADVLNVKSSVGNVMIGAAMAVYPSWTATFFFMFTAPYYAISLFLAVFSMYLTVKGMRFIPLSVLLMACSLGVYQAYLPFVATQYVIVIILMITESKNDYLKIIKSSFYFLGQLVAGGVVYFVITKVSLMATHQELTDYKGVASIGSLSGFSLSEFMGMLWNDFFGLSYNNHLELSYNYVTKFMYAFLFILSGMLIIGMIVRFINERLYLKAAELAVMVFIFVIAINSIYIVCNDVYALMRFSYVNMLIFPICLIDRYKGFLVKQRCKDIILQAEWVMTAVLAAGVISYCHFANAQYLSLNLGFEQASGFYGTIITQIKELDGYEPEMKTAFIGYDNIQDKSLYRNQVMKVFEMSGRDAVMAEAYSIEYFLKYYCGFDTELVEADRDNSEIKQMPVYPLEGSIRIVDNVVVVKFSE